MVVHLERFDELRATIQEGTLVLEDGLGHLLERVPALFDRFHQPPGGLDLAFDVFLGLVGSVSTGGAAW
jgi:hypothetical protein